MVGDRADVGARVEGSRGVGKHRVEAQPGDARAARIEGEVGLPVGVDGEDPLAAPGELRGDLEGEGGLPDPALVGDDGDHPHQRDRLTDMPARLRAAETDSAVNTTSRARGMERRITRRTGRSP